MIYKTINFSILGNWTSGLMWSTHRNRGCALQINNSTVANIGGQPKPSNPSVGSTIDTYDFVTNTESLAVATMAFNRKMHGCALIPNGPEGNPTVAICKYSFFYFKIELCFTNFTKEVVALGLK